MDSSYQAPASKEETLSYPDSLHHMASSDEATLVTTNLQNISAREEEKVALGREKGARSEDSSTLSDDSDGNLDGRFQESVHIDGPVGDEGTSITDLDRLQWLVQSLAIQYETSRKLTDLEQAIAYQSRALLLIPDGHAYRLSTLCLLGNSYLCRFQHLGQLADIEQAIELQSKAASLIPNEHAIRPGMLNNLGSSYLCRFQHSGNLADLNQAIECLSQALLAIPDGDTEKPGMLNNLGGSYLRRFGYFGELTDIDHAIERMSEALSLTADGNVNKPTTLENLGNSHKSRFEHLGKLADIDKAVEFHAQALSLTPDRHSERPGRLSSLGRSHLCRFEHFGELADIDQAIACQSQALSITPNGHASKCGVLNYLGISHRCRFQRFAELADIEQAIKFQSQALLLTPNEHQYKHSRFTSLSISYSCRFEHLGELADIDEAIALQSQAIALIPNGHTNMPAALSNLGNSHLRRFQHLGEPEDTKQAITYLSQAVSLTPDDHVNKPEFLTNLGDSYRRQFEHLKDREDIDKAIKFQSQGVSLILDGHHTNHPGILNNLGVSYLCRLENFSELGDIDQAIHFQSQGVLRVPDGDPEKPELLSNLGNSYHERFQQLGDLADLDQAIVFQSQALPLVPDGHASKSGLFSNLGISFRSRFEHLGEPADMHRLIESFRMAAVSPTGPSIKRFDAARIWAQHAATLDQSSSLSAYQLTMELLPKVVWIGSTVGHRYDNLKSIGTIAIEAAAAAITAGKYTLALEWLEEGRSIIWNQTLQLRTKFDDLSDLAPKLAEALKQVAHKLENAGQQTSTTDSAGDSTNSLEAASQKHHRLAEKYDDLLRQARELPGFRNFLRPKQVADLLPGARSGPVVVINVHSTRCDALILRLSSTEISHVPLPDMSHTEVNELQRHMQKTLGSRGISERKPYVDRPELVDGLKGTLAALWHKIVKLVLTFLGYTGKLPIDQLPHITWCTTGALSFLPIHAAGWYDRAGNNIFNFAVSSYAPTVSALLPSSSHSYELGGIVAVSQEATPGCEPLPETKTELTRIQPHAQLIPYMQLANKDATVEAVLDAMEKHSSVHLACHGSQDLKHPTQSRFYLHDGGLTLSDIAKRSLKNKGMAFLSACQTAAGDNKLPDEAIHLAAGMLVAGYPTVIATLWSIDDEDAPIVADHVYGQLAKDGKLDGGRAARALHAAVGVLRDQLKEGAFARWVPYVHIGI